MILNRELSLFPLHQSVPSLFSHECAKFCSITLSNCRVMRFQTLKNRPNLHANMEGLHRDSHIWIFTTPLWINQMRRLLKMISLVIITTCHSSNMCVQTCMLLFYQHNSDVYDIEINNFSSSKFSLGLCNMLLYNSW